MRLAMQGKKANILYLYELTQKVVGITVPLPPDYTTDARTEWFRHAKFALRLARDKFQATGRPNNDHSTFGYVPKRVTEFGVDAGPYKWKREDRLSFVQLAQEFTGARQKAMLTNANISKFEAIVDEVS